MQRAVPSFRKYLFVCENERAEGDCCSERGRRLRERLKDAVKTAGLSKKLRVARTGCQDACSEGPNVLLMPDHVWFKNVELDDVEAIVRAAGLSPE